MQPLANYNKMEYDASKFSKDIWFVDLINKGVMELIVSKFEEYSKKDFRLLQKNPSFNQISSVYKSCMQEFYSKDF